MILHSCIFLVIFVYEYYIGCSFYMFLSSTVELISNWQFLGSATIAFSERFEPYLIETEQLCCIHVHRPATGVVWYLLLLDSSYGFRIPVQVPQ
jgi:hypothetical protein